ncbi:unnamed protein product [Kuraishia capsulata CBS 1993]|uniref:ER membrane protein complex subunit 6 n=1 Tax=Kuraishia capsulata CBS 1993 TaxID=1382522 RepID=W6MVB8_9ASCO|nr:uncharacterized protein KUCA_T00002166001 [Kuraishia capsulata CBS 1993]CDK26195.1 unnamed protein product [Kuraishia capsulata CBS 1993]
MSAIRKDFSVTYKANIVANINTFHHIHDLTSLVLGSSSGILQLESYHGLIYFLVTNIIVTLAFFVVILSGNLKLIPKYYEKGLPGLVFEGLSRSLAGFFMMWCLTTALIST